MSNKSYPRIIEIKEDGKIIAMDKDNKLNTDLNTLTLTDEQQYKIFGGILISKKLQDDPSRYYNEKDYLREKQLEKDNKINKKINHWLDFGFIVLLVITIVFTVKSCVNEEQEDLFLQDKEYRQHNNWFINADMRNTNSKFTKSSYTLEQNAENNKKRNEMIED